MPSLNDLLVALTIFLEARGERPEGREAIAHVIATRMAERNQNALDVCLKPRAFSCWNKRPLMPTVRAYADGKLVKPDEIDIFRHSMDLADRIKEGKVSTGTWNHFYNPAKSNPSWAPFLKDIQDIGKHRFGNYKYDPKVEGLR